MSISILHIVDYKIIYYLCACMYILICELKMY